MLVFENVLHFTIMIDIWGRPLSASKKPETDGKVGDIKKIIEDEIAETLNLSSVDPEEIVVFQDRQGKLKSSNVSISNLLLKNPTAKDDSVAIFKQGKLLPSVIISEITNKLSEFEIFLNNFLGSPRQEFDIQLVHIKVTIDNLARLRTEYDAHINQFGTLRRNFNITDNAVEKFFGKKNIKPDDIAMTLADITGKIDKIPVDLVQQLTYVIDSGNIDWFNSNIIDFASGGERFKPNYFRGINVKNGIYRYTLLSNEQFNMTCYNGRDIIGKGVNVVVFNFINQQQLPSNSISFTISTSNANLVRLKILYMLEFLAPEIV